MILRQGIIYDNSFGLVESGMWALESRFDKQSISLDKQSVIVGWWYYLLRANISQELSYSCLLSALIKNQKRQGAWVA